MSDIPTLLNSRIKLTTYADDITLLSTHTNITTTKQQVHSYMQDTFNWTKQYKLILNPYKNTNNAIHSTPSRALKYNK